jgi:hypothetical protein
VMPLANHTADTSGTQTQSVPTEGGLPIAAGGATGPQPVEGPTGLFVTKTQVYLGGDSYAVRLPWGTGAHIGKLGVAYPAPTTHRPMLLKNDGQTAPLAAVHPAAPATSYDDWVAADGNGPMVAWAENGKDSGDIVAFDTATMSEVGRKTMLCGENTTSGCPRPYVVSDGVVFIETVHGTEAWNPVTGTSGLIGDGTVQQAHNKVLTTFQGGTTNAGLVGPEWSQAPQRWNGDVSLSYDGAWMLDVNGRPKVINWRQPGESITYRPPGQVAAATFDTDGSVLVVTNDSGTYTGWDCALGGECKTVVAPSKQEIRLVASDT